MKDPCVYILASARNGTLYIGVASDIYGRMAEHKQGLIEGVSNRYATKMLVYDEMHLTMEGAIIREKQLKEWKRVWKIRLIESMNPEWCDLFNEATGVLREGLADRARIGRN